MAIAALPKVFLGSGQELLVNVRVDQLDTTDHSAKIVLSLPGGDWVCKSVDAEAGSPLSFVDQLFSGTIPLDYQGSNAVTWGDIAPGTYPFAVDFSLGTVSVIRLQDALTIAPLTGTIVGASTGFAERTIRVVSPTMSALVTVGGLWNEVRVGNIETLDAAQNGRLTALEGADTGQLNRLTALEASETDYETRIGALETRHPTTLALFNDLTTQTPVGIDVEMQVTFGPADTSNPWFDVATSGDVTLKQNLAAFDSMATLNLQRATSQAATLTFFYVKKNGEIIGRSRSVEQTDAKSTVPLIFPFPSSGIIGDVFGVYMLRDSIGNNSGDLVSHTPTLAGIPASPSATVLITATLDV